MFESIAAKIKTTARRLDEVTLGAEPRMSTDIPELDRVLGGGSHRGVNDTASRSPRSGNGRLVTWGHHSKMSCGQRDMVVQGWSLFCVTSG